MLSLNNDSDIPLYSQLSTQIMESIVRGDLSTGDTLPSVRVLAGDLGVNMHTVNKSYHELESKGIIEIVPKKGAVIKANEQKISAKRIEILSEEFRPIVVEALVNGMKKEEIHQIITNIIIKIKKED
ncbi:GntR family transcriptional regulator [Paraliobacillus quinghaiensis]|uniref:GntR family transcriptional regulator n=1 Tax=Paraliobacillus quinghaiensis TaxID=470815 RepID=A0A917TDT3_9BACI|nr:GntR family transcriptional regulator [Paraliobacillus quinghaiensis]GGM18551.1 GntR family transcriptional regulator [Paraliobacillus quinghaiensis]